MFWSLTTFLQYLKASIGDDNTNELGKNEDAMNQVFLNVAIKQQKTVLNEFSSGDLVMLQKCIMFDYIC